MRENSFDIVRLACDLPYLNENEAHELEFNEEYLQKKKLKGHSHKEI